MSLHKQPLTPLERNGLERHRLPIGVPSVTSDCFRFGIAYTLRQLEIHESMDQLVHLLRQGTDADVARARVVLNDMRNNLVAAKTVDTDKPWVGAGDAKA